MLAVSRHSISGIRRCVLVVHAADRVSEVNKVKWTGETAFRVADVIENVDIGIRFDTSVSNVVIENWGGGGHKARLAQIGW